MLEEREREGTGGVGGRGVRGRGRTGVSEGPQCSTLHKTAKLRSLLS